MSAIGICSKTRVFKPHISLHERLPKVQTFYLSTHTNHSLDIMNEKIFEPIFVDIKFQDKVISCGNIYRSPSNNNNAQKMFLADLDNILRKINKRESFLLDFNYNIFDSNEPNVTKFIDGMYDQGFSSLINRPTSSTYITCSTLIVLHYLTKYGQTVTHYKK